MGIGDWQNQQGQGYSNQYGEYEQRQEVIEGEKNEEINSDLPKVTVEEMIKMDIKEENNENNEEEPNMEKKDEKEEDQKEENNWGQQEKGDHYEENQHNEKQNKEDNNYNKNENEEEENNIIENKDENQEQNPLPDLKEIIEDQDQNKEPQEQENEHNEELQDEDGNNNEENIQNEEKKEEGYYYVQKEDPYSQGQQMYPQEQDNNKEMDANVENKEDFRETEYKDDEYNAQNQGEIENQKKEMPELESEFGPNKYFPRPRVPITKIEYFEYVVPKKKVSPFPNVPFQFLVGEEAYQKRDKRSHSHSNTYQPIFKREQFEQTPRRPMPISILGPKNTRSLKIIEIPPTMGPKQQMKMLIRENRSYIHTMPREINRPDIHHLHHGGSTYHLPHGPLPHGPTPYRIPHGPQPYHIPHGPTPHHIPHGPLPYYLPHGPTPHHIPHGPLPYHLPYGPLPHGTLPHHLPYENQYLKQILPHRPFSYHSHNNSFSYNSQNGPFIHHLPRRNVPHRFNQNQIEINDEFDEERRLFERNEENNSYPPFIQTHIYPRPKRRDEEYYDEYTPENMNVKTKYFIKRNQQSQEENDYDYDENNYFTSSANGPRGMIRSVNQGGNDGRFGFNFGENKTKNIFKKVANTVRLLNNIKPSMNKRVNSQKNIYYTQGNNSQSNLNTGKRVVYHYQVKRIKK